MKVSDFDYELPPEHIAREPVRPRDAARLLAHDVASGRTEHLRVRDLERVLRAGDLLVLNDTRVLSARLFGERRSGGRVELLATEPVEGAVWRALVNPARKPRPGERIALEGGAAEAHMIERPPGPDGAPGIEWIVEFRRADGGALDVLELFERIGHVPLPPYVRRPDSAEDREAYQTVYARRPGAVAAPTAGLHFTPELLARLEAAGVERAHLTLHVGLGTFRPVEVEDPSQHLMHAERFDLSPQTAAAVARCRARGGRVVAVGTTTARVLESRADDAGRLEPGRGETRLFVLPGHRFLVTDALLTNFHLPRSTLLMLVSAFAGTERVRSLYAEALRAGYRFYSYGDAMLLQRS